MKGKYERGEERIEWEKVERKGCFMNNIKK